MTRAFLVQLRLSARALARSPTSSAFIIATLSLCIAATTGVFSIAYGVLVRALPYRDPARLLWISSVRPGRSDSPFSLPEFMDLRERARSIGLAAYASWNPTRPTATVAQRLQGIRISAGAFDLLGMRPSAGRLLRDADDAAAADNVAVLSYAFWQHNFTGSSAVIGTAIPLNGEPYVVVGVLPRHFPLPLRDVDVVVPLAPDRDPRRHLRNSVNFLRIVGRLAAGSTPDLAARELGALTADLRAQFPTEYATKLGVRVTPLQEYLVGPSRLTLVVLLACVGLMLTMAFVNVLNLLLVRSATRQGEIAVRRALGASAWHVASQLLAEGALLAAAGAIGGTLLAFWGLTLVTTVGVGAIPRLDEVHVDGAVLVFVVTLMAVATAVFSLAPLGRALRAAPHAALRAEGRTGGGGGGGHRGSASLQGAFVVSQIALAVVLTTTTAVLLRSLTRLQRVELGYRPDSVFVVRLSLPPKRYATPADVAGFYERLRSTLERQPEVRAVGVVSVAPLSGLLATVPFSVPGRPPIAYRERPSANYRAVSPGYLTSIRARVVAGRAFAESDDAAAPPVALISRALADRYFGATDPLGQDLLIDDNDTGPRAATVVGVVDDMRHVDLQDPTPLDIYIPLKQIHRDGVGLVTNNQFWTVRLASPPAAFGPVFLRALGAVDPEAATSEMGSMSGYVDRTLGTRRFTVGLLLGVSIIALTLAAVGVYGVMAFSVTQRRREIGVRLALGTPARWVMRLVLWRAIRLSALGIASGVAGSLMTGRAVAGLLFGSGPTDAWTLIAVSALLGALSVAASWIPARRAARVDPMLVLSGG